MIWIRFELGVNGSQGMRPVVWPVLHEDDLLDQPRPVLVDEVDQLALAGQEASLDGSPLPQLSHVLVRLQSSIDHAMKDAM